jgi:hypothetical protein
LLTTSYVWFPIGANISATYAADSLSVEARLKQLAVLCEEVIVEVGSLEISHERGADWTYRTTSARRQAEAMLARGSGEFRALDALSLIPAAVRTRLGFRTAPAVLTLDEDVELVETYDRLTQRSFSTRFSCRSNPREAQRGNVSRLLVFEELVRSAIMGVAVAVEREHEALLAREFESFADMRCPLRLPVLDVTGASWSSLVEIRANPAVQAFRRSLVECERLASGLSEPEALPALEGAGFFEKLRRAERAVGSKRHRARWLELGCFSGNLPKCTVGRSKKRRKWTVLTLGWRQADPQAIENKSQRA